MNVSEARPREYSTDELADWVERQPDSWWIVDGDPRLTREVDFPCPANELAMALRDHHVPVVVKSTGWIGPKAAEHQIPPGSFEDLPPREGRLAARVIHLAWADGGDDWMLYEYLPIEPDQFIS